MKTETNEGRVINRPGTTTEATAAHRSLTDRHMAQSPRELEREIDQTRMRIENSIQELERRLQPDALIRTFASPIRDNGEEFISNLATKVRTNPVPVLVAMTGLAWLMASDSTSRRRSSVAPAMAGGYSGHEGHDAEPSAGGIKRSIGDTAAKASDQARGIAAQVKGKIAQATDAVSSAVDSATSSAQRLGGDASDSMATARHQAGAFAAESRTIAAAATAGVTRLYREQPVALGVAALAIGAVAGALLPPTRREDQLFGPQRDRMLADSREQAQELYESAKTEVARQAENLAEQAKAGLENMVDAGPNGTSGVQKPATS